MTFLKVLIYVQNRKTKENRPILSEIPKLSKYIGQKKWKT